MPTVYAAMLELQDRTQFQGINSKSYDTFDSAVALAAALFNQHATDAGAIKMFIAPEYTFSAHSAVASGIPKVGDTVKTSTLSRTQKHDIYKSLCETSSRYTDIIIVAGSIHYDSRFHTGSLTKKKTLSVCPVAYGGQLILKCFKRGYDGFTPGVKKDGWATKDNGNTFSVSGLTFGVEICLDHQDEPVKLAHGRTIDVHLLVSEGANPLPSRIAAKDGGLMIHCDMSGQAVGNGIRVISSSGSQVLYDKASRGQVVGAARQPLSNGASVALYSGAV